MLIFQGVSNTYVWHQQWLNFCPRFADDEGHPVEDFVRVITDDDGEFSCE